MDEAIEHYLLAIKFRPYYPKAHHNLGNAYMLQNLPEKAEKEYQIAIKQNPANYNFYYSLSNAYKSQGMNDKAKESYNAARELPEGRRHTALIHLPVQYSQARREKLKSEPVICYININEELSRKTSVRLSGINSTAQALSPHTAYFTAQPYSLLKHLLIPLFILMITFT